MYHGASFKRFWSLNLASELAALDAGHGCDVLLPPHVHPGVRLQPLVLRLLLLLGGVGGLRHEGLGQGAGAYQGGGLGGRVGRRV